jgi:hypothetical protein
MLRHRRAADRQPLGKVAHRARPAGQSLEDRPAGGIGKSGEG